MKRTLSIFLAVCLILSTFVIGVPIVSAQEGPVQVPGTTVTSPNYSWQRTMVKTTDGRVVLFYKQGSYLYYNVYNTAASTWGTAVQLTTSGTVNTSRDVIIDSNNNIYVAYAWRSSSLYSYAMYFIKLTYNPATGIITKDPSTPRYLVGNTSVSLAKTSNGTLWLARHGSKVDKTDFSGRSKSAIDVLYSTNDGVSWALPDDTSDKYGKYHVVGPNFATMPFLSNVSLFSPRLVPYNNGLGLFFLEKGAGTTTRTLCFSYRLNTAPLTSKWSTSIQVFGDSSNNNLSSQYSTDTEALYSVASDSSGNFHLAYCSHLSATKNGLFYAKFTAGGSSLPNSEIKQIDPGISTSSGMKYPLYPSVSLVDGTPWIFYASPAVDQYSQIYYRLAYRIGPTFQSGQPPYYVTLATDTAKNTYTSALPSNSKPYVSWSKQNGTSGVYFWTDDVPPVVDITSPSDGTAVTGGTVNVQASASDAGTGIAKVEFLVDGVLKYTDGTPPSPYSCSWDTTGLSGSHTITAKAYDIAGNTSTHTHTITINQPPVASFGWSTGSIPYPAVDWAISFIDSSTDSDGYITSWSWDFGDGGTANWQNPVHYYYATGTYNVRLTVTDNKGATNTKTIPITISNYPADQLPVAYFTYQNLGNRTVKFNSTGSYDPDGGPITYLWAFGDGGTSTEPNPTHQYPGAATFTVSLMVTDPSGGHGFLTQRVTVTP